MAKSEPTPTLIPLVLIGVTRPAAIGIQPLVLDSHNASVLSAALASDIVPSLVPHYQITAALDFTNSPAPYRYSADNLRLLLHTINPRPRSLVLGTNYELIPVSEVENIWDEYLAFLKAEEGPDVKAVLIVLSRTHPENGPPPPGAAERVVRQLDAVFRA